MVASRMSTGTATANGVGGSNGGTERDDSHLHRADANGREQRRAVNLDVGPSTRFALPNKRSYVAQYSKIYFQRLRQLREAMEVSARAAFGPASPTLRYAKNIVDASEDADDGKSKEEESGLETVMIGIVFREMKGKPSILAMYEQPSAHSLIPDPPQRARVPFGSVDDKVYLEDDQVRCALNLSALDPRTAATLITGLVVAVRGREDRATGAFAVSAIANVGPAPLLQVSPSDDEKVNDNDNGDGKSVVVCIVSSPIGPASELLLEGLRGTMDDDEEDNDDDTQREFTRSVAQLIVAGNVTAKPPPPQSSASAAVNPDTKDRQARALRDADAWLSGVAATLPVAVMPGADDATNALLPQQPLHRCLFPGASRNRNFKRVPNPFACCVNEKLFVGTCGQNVDDIALYDCASTVEGAENERGSAEEVTVQGESDEAGTYRAEGEKVLDILEMMVMNRHIAPTCPDTLGSYPFTESDPFVLENSPHVLFAANQKQFATRLVKIDTDTNPNAPTARNGNHAVPMDMVDQEGLTQDCGTYIRLISVPRFDETGQAVFVDVESLEVNVREFGLNM